MKFLVGEVWDICNGIMLIVRDDAADDLERGLFGCVETIVLDDSDDIWTGGDSLRWTREELEVELTAAKPYKRARRISP